MISEQSLMARMKHLEAAVLSEWIELGLVVPHRSAGGILYDEVDEARIALLCDLHYGMGIEHQSLSVVLSLVDQLHRTRHSLRAMTAAVWEQPDEVRIAIASRARIVLTSRSNDGNKS